MYIPFDDMTQVFTWWRTIWRHDIIWRHYIHFVSLYTFNAMTYFWRYGVPFDAMTYYLMSWRTFDILHTFDVYQDILLDVMMTGHNFDIKTYFLTSWCIFLTSGHTILRHNALLTYWPMFWGLGIILDIMKYSLTTWHNFDVMTYLLTSCDMCDVMTYSWHHDVFVEVVHTSLHTFDIVMYYLMSTGQDEHFDVTCTSWCNCDVIVDVITYLWPHDLLLKSWRSFLSIGTFFDSMSNYLRSYTIYVMVYFLCHGILFDIVMYLKT